MWRFDCAPEDIWPVLADTERFNEAAGILRHTIETTLRDDGSVAFVGRAKVGPFTLGWDEIPANWVSNRWFVHRRAFRNGPLKQMTATLKLFVEAGGCRAEYTLEAQAANILGDLLLATRFFSSSEKTFGRLAREANAFCSGETETAFDFPLPALANGGEEHLRGAVEQIEATPFGHGLAGRLADYVRTRPEVDIRRIRPIALARHWKVPERHVIELCLEASRKQVLAMRWDILCPRCQGAEASSSTLDQLPTGAHCDTCNIDYGRDFASNIELAFHPNNLVRGVDGRDFCLFGPWTTPHVRCQITVEAGASRQIDARFGHGTYRLRTLEAGGEETIDWESGEFPDVVAHDQSVEGQPAAEPGKISFINQTALALTFIVEELGWRRDALTAHRVTAMQAFRDLCDMELLRPGDNLDIDSVTFMFIDLQGSTALYERVGDLRAFALVRDFFTVLSASIRANNGTVVKTIGDAVHGAFVGPGDALASAVQIQGDIEVFNASSGRTPIAVKIGLHVGSCIAVTLSERLDYYGTTVNKAARLADQSGGGEIVLSSEMVAEPSTSDVLASYTPDADSAALKGFDLPMPFFRITRQQLDKARNS